MSKKNRLGERPHYSEYKDLLVDAFASRSQSTPVAASEGGDCERDVERGAMGNTPLSNRPGETLGEISEDTVHLSVWCDWGVNADQLFERLRLCQRESQGKAEQYIPEVDTNDDNGLDYDPDALEFADDDAAMASLDVGERFIEGHGRGYLEFGDCLWKVGTSGIGGQEGRSYYRYVIRSGGILIGFRRDRHETVSNMWVEMGSIPLAAKGGLEGVWGELRRMFDSEGITVLKDIVSRVDVYTDKDVCGVDEFCEHFYENKKVCRARKIGHYGEEANFVTYFSGRRYTGFSVGSSIKLRVYDKRYELEKDPIKQGVFAEKYNGIPKVLTRIEFQLRRVALKDFLLNGRDRIEGVDTYLAARDQLWKYLTEDWFRLTENEVDKKNNHQNRAKTWVIWEIVQNAVNVVAKEIFRFKRTPRPDMEHMYRMGLGCLVKLTLWERGSIERVGDVIAHFVERVRKGGYEEFRDVVEKHADDLLLRVGHFGEYRE